MDTSAVGVYLVTIANYNSSKICHDVSLGKHTKAKVVNYATLISYKCIKTSWM